MVRWVKQAASGAKAVVKLVEYAEMGATMKGHKVCSNLFLIIDSFNRPGKALFGRSKTNPPKNNPIRGVPHFHLYIYDRYTLRDILSFRHRRSRRKFVVGR